MFLDDLREIVKTSVIQRAEESWVQVNGSNA